MSTPDYETDFYTWTQQQTTALRAKDWSGLDVAHLAEELESLGYEQAHAVESHLVIVLTHLLKWRYQLERRGRGWRTSVRVGRQQIARRLRRNPGLRPDLPTFLTNAYADARKRAMDETDLPLATFPEACPSKPVCRRERNLPSKGPIASEPWIVKMDPGVLRNRRRALWRCFNRRVGGHLHRLCSWLSCLWAVRARGPRPPSAAWVAPQPAAYWRRHSGAKAQGLRPVRSWGA